MTITAHASSTCNRIQKLLNVILCVCVCAHVGLSFLNVYFLLRVIRVNCMPTYTYTDAVKANIRYNHMRSDPFNWPAHHARFLIMSKYFNIHYI